MTIGLRHSFGTIDADSAHPRKTFGSCTTLIIKILYNEPDLSLREAFKPSSSLKPKPLALKTEPAFILGTWVTAKLPIGKLQ
jgi:hypothetical protein